MHALNTILGIRLCLLNFAFILVYFLFVIVTLLVELLQFSTHKCVYYYYYVQYRHIKDTMCIGCLRLFVCVSWAL